MSKERAVAWLRMVGVAIPLAVWIMVITARAEGGHETGTAPLARAEEGRLPPAESEQGRRRPPGLLERRGLKPAPRDCAPNCVWPDVSSKPSPLDITLRGVHFVIPRDYIFATFSGVAPAFDLSVIATTFAPYTPETASDFPRDFLRIGLTILVTANARYDESEATRASWFSILDRYRLEPSELSATLSGTTDPVPATLSMQRALPDNRFQPTRDDRFDPMYPSGHEREVIYCTSPLTHFVQTGLQRLDNLRCQHFFMYAGVSVELHYRREYLADWARLRDQTIALLGSFRRG